MNVRDLQNILYMIFQTIHFQSMMIAEYSTVGTLERVKWILRTPRVGLTPTLSYNKQYLTKEI